MKIISERTKDFGYLRILNFFTDTELYDIWREIFYLDYIMDVPRFQEQRAKDSDLHDNGTPKMSGNGIFIDQIYTDPEFSSIYKYSRKLFNDEISESFSKTHPANVISKINRDTILVNRYRHSQEYAPHVDNSTFTSLTVLLHEPKKITGGELLFPDYDITFGREHNSCILFPSWVSHTVSKLKCFDNAGRYSISQFLNIQ